MERKGLAGSIEKEAYDKGLADGYERGVKHGYEAGKIKWNPVTEKLPEPFISVLVYMPEEYPMPVVREGYYTDCGFVIPVLMGVAGKVTHWAEMPGGPAGI